MPIGDIIACDQGVGEVVSIVDGNKPLVRPFPIPEQASWTGPTVCFVAQGEWTTVKAAAEWKNSAIQDHDAKRAQLAIEAAELRTRHYAVLAKADRDWYRER